MHHSSSVVSKSRYWATPLGIAILLLATGCAKTGGDEVAWARAALERNPQLEVVAMDAESRVFTVKHRGTGDVRVVGLDSLAAVPVADLTSAGSAAPTPSQTSTAVAPAPSEAAPPDTQPAASTQSPSTAAGDESGTSPVASESNYIIQREGGQLRVSGPGVSIVSANPTNSTRAPEPATRTETPIVCEGARFLHLDRRNISINGTAVIARGGCELHITNSTIDAAGTAISVQDATVHIANSNVTGEQASLDAGGRARVFVRGSTFKGISRRAESAEINDQGGNSWR